MRRTGETAGTANRSCVPFALAFLWASRSCRTPEESQKVVAVRSAITVARPGSRAALIRLKTSSALVISISAGNGTTAGMPWSICRAAMLLLPDSRAGRQAARNPARPYPYGNLDRNDQSRKPPCLVRLNDGSDLRRPLVRLRPGLPRHLRGSRDGLNRERKSVQAKPGNAMADINELILADHLQIMRWAGLLGDLSRRARGRDDRAELAATWETLVTLIDLHMRAEDEICGPTVF